MQLVSILIKHFIGLIIRPIIIYKGSLSVFFFTSFHSLASSWIDTNTTATTTTSLLSMSIGVARRFKASRGILLSGLLAVAMHLRIASLLVLVGANRAIWVKHRSTAHIVLLLTRHADGVFIKWRLNRHNVARSSKSNIHDIHIYVKSVAWVVV